MELKETWPVWPAYRWTLGREFIEPILPATPKLYVPAARTELPGLVYRLYEGDTDAVMSFVQEYGLLGYGPLELRSQSKVEAMARKALAWIGLSREPRSGWAEPVGWVFAHARGVRLVMDGLLALREGNEEAARGLVQRVLPDPKTRVGTRRPPAYEMGGGAGFIRFDLTDKPEPGSPLETLASIVATVLEWNLYDLAPAVRVGTAGEVEWKPWSPALITTVYRMLATYPVARCQECGLPFVVTDPRQRFCPPRMGERESRCAMRHRQRDRRARLSARQRLASGVEEGGQSG